MTVLLGVKINLIICEGHNCIVFKVDRKEQKFGAVDSIV